MIPTFDKIFVEREVRALPMLFLQYLPSDFKPSSVFDFCCGLVNEEPVLKSLYGDAISLLSIDENRDVEVLAQRLGRTSFRRAKIENLDALVKEPFDFVVGRNIPMFHYGRFGDADDPYISDYWPSFFLGLKDYLIPDAYLLLTFGSESEFAKAKTLLYDAEYDVLLAEKNSLRIPSDRLMFTPSLKDSYVILAQKSDEN